MQTDVQYSTLPRFLRRSRRVFGTRRLPDGRGVTAAKNIYIYTSIKNLFTPVVKWELSVVSWEYVYSGKHFRRATGGVWITQWM